MVTLGAAGQLWTALFISVGVITARVTSYTLETTSAVTFSGNAAEQFGYAVVQHRDSAFTTWLVVSSPLARGRLGLVQKCQIHPATRSRSCTEMGVQNGDMSTNGTLGLTLAKEESPSGKVLACAPLGHLSCGKNVFLKSSCYLFDNNLNQEPIIAAGFQDCPISPIDIVILIDGSGSVSDADFERTKDFVKAIIRTFKRKDNTQIAVVQFSQNVRLELSFATFRTSPDVEAIVSAIRQMRAATYTANAINFIMDRVFVPGGGAHSGAQKVLVVVTDGASNGGGLDAAVQRTRAGNVVTYAIGVGDAFKPGSTGYAELRLLASDPDADHMFPVNDYNALNSVLRRLEEKIFSIEGASGDLSTFEMELAATGMSAVINKGTITLGAVGAHGWMGGVVRHFSNGNSITSTNSTLDWQNKEGPSIERDSYLGYSLIQVRLSTISLLATGAPHSHHTGTVYLFDIRASDSKLMIYQTLPGHQLGSYFGAVLCAVDLEQGGSATALLLVSAPFYHARGEEGRVYVYRRADDGRFNLSQELSGRDGELRARFGSAVASMGDVTGDGWPDVAIGAPGEGDEGAGAVYLFSGRRDGFSSGHSQRISGASQSGRVRMFGRSLHSLMDVSGDGLRDLAVGALGNAMVLRSRPIVNVSATITFKPARIPVHEQRCANPSTSSTIITLGVCFICRSAHIERNVPTLVVTYDITLDVGKRAPRATFNRATASAGGVGSSFKQSNLSVAGGAESSKSCLDINVYIACESEDLSSPVSIGVNFSVASVDASQPSAVLNQLVPSHVTTQLQFQKDCGADNLCIADLQVEITLDSSGPLLLGVVQNVTSLVTLRNRGEESHFTRLTLRVPGSLQYRSANSASALRNLDCSFTNGQLVCSVDNPVMRASTEVTLRIVFDAACNDTADTSLTIAVSATCANEDAATLKDNSATVERPLLYAVNAVLKGSDSLHLSFNKSETEDKQVSLSFTAQNLGSIPATVELAISVPTSGEDRVNFLRVDRAVTQPTGGVCKTSDTPGHDGTSRPTNPTAVDYPVWDCHNKLCTHVLCSGLLLRQGDAMDITLALTLTVPTITKETESKLVIVSSAQLHVDKNRFRLSSRSNFHSSQVRLVLEVQEVHNNLPIIIGSSIGGLLLLALVTAVLYKTGFFKRDYQAKLQEAVQEGQQEPGQQEPGQQEPGQQEPGQQEPGQQEPGQQEPEPL